MVFCVGECHGPGVCSTHCSPAGRNRHHSLLQRVLYSQHHTSSSKRQLAPFVPDIALEPLSASGDMLKQYAEDLFWRSPHGRSSTFSTQSSTGGVVCSCR